MLSISAGGVEIIMWIFSEVAELPTGSRYRRRQRRFKTRARDWTLRAYREVEGKKDQG